MLNAEKFKDFNLPTSVKEADAWIVYDYVPVGTKIKIRYDLEYYEEGIVIALLKDIYNKKN